MSSSAPSEEWRAYWFPRGHSSQAISERSAARRVQDDCNNWGRSATSYTTSTETGASAACRSAVPTRLSATVCPAKEEEERRAECTLNAFFVPHRQPDSGPIYTGLNFDVKRNELMELSARWLHKLMEIVPTKPWSVPLVSTEPRGLSET